MMGRKTFFEESLEEALGGFEAVGGPSDVSHVVGFSGGNGKLVQVVDATNRVVPPDPALSVLPFSVLRTSAGGYRTDFDWSNPVGGVSYFVDAVLGSDSNSGLSASLPFKGLKTAITAATAGGVAASIYIKAGVHTRSVSGNGWLLDMTWPTTPLALIGWGGLVDIWGAGLGSALSWTSEGANTYSAAMTANTCHAVWDTTIADPNDATLPTSLTQYSTQAELEASASGFWLDTPNGRIRVKKVSLTTPGVNTILLGRVATYPGYTGNLLYMKNIRWLGREGTLRLVKSDYVPGSKFIADNCSFGYGVASLNQDAIALGNWEIMALRNCKAPYGGKDCFNYHQDVGSHAHGIMLEEACTPKYAAWRRAEKRGPYQASTVHDGIIAVRVGGTYRSEAGPCLQDEGSDGYRCKAWTVGCTLDATNAPSGVGEGGTPWDYPALGGNYTDNWFDNCTFTGGSGPVVANATSTVHVRDPSGTAWDTLPTGSGPTTFY